MHAGIFVPVLNATAETDCFTFSPLGNAATKLAYWDEEAWASVLVVSTSSLQPGEAGRDGHARSNADEAAAAAEKERLVGPGKETETKTKKRKADAKDAAKQKKVSLHSKMRRCFVADCGRLSLRIFNFGVTATPSFMA